MNKAHCRPDYHITIVYCGGCHIHQYRESDQTLKLFEIDCSENYMTVSSSDWTAYNDAIHYRESKYYCMVSNGSFINIPKPHNMK